MPQKRLSDKWYENRGVKPPESIPHGTEEDIQAKMAGVQHGNWTQRGNHIFCGMCPHVHASPIPVNYLLTGTDNRGLPILTKLG